MIRRMVKEDLTECARILCAVYNTQTWGCRWSLAKAYGYLEDYFDAKKFIGFVSLEDGRLCGAIFCHEKICWNNNEVFLDEMFVNPEKQRNGHGTLLIKAVEDLIRTDGLGGFTLLSNRNSTVLKFYHRNKFSDGEHVLSLYKIVGAEAEEADEEPQEESDDTRAPIQTAEKEQEPVNPASRLAAFAAGADIKEPMPAPKPMPVPKPAVTADLSEHDNRGV